MATTTLPEVEVLTSTPMPPPHPVAPSQFIRRFDQLSRTDVSLAGGKGANLGEMTRAGLPVPPGFVILVPAYQRAIDANNLRARLADPLAKIDVDDIDALSVAANDARTLVRCMPIPDDVRQEIAEAYCKLGCSTTEPSVAVRSSATVEDAASASFAGMFESFLDVRGTDAVLHRVRDCWASAFSPRVLFYRAKQNLPIEMPVAVVVQRMIPSQKAGVLFTVNPATHDSTSVVIEASWGLGEPVVQGRVTPDRYVVEKSSLAVGEVKVGSKECIMPAQTEPAKRAPEHDPTERVLGDHELVALTMLAIKAEEHLGCPQDIEFAIDGTGVYLTQTRPVTTLAPHSVKAKVAPAKPSAPRVGAPVVIARGLGASPGTARGIVRVLTDVAAGRDMRDGEVLVAPMTSPDWVPVMRRAAAIVTNSGGMTSHAAIVSRELGVPCVVGTHDGTHVLRTGMEVTVDGGAGLVMPADGAAQAADANATRPGPASTKRIGRLATMPFTTATRLYVNLADVEKAESVAALEVDGVGLLRAEFLLLAALGNTHPRQLLAEGKRDELVNRMGESLGRIARAFAPRPVVYRSMDFRSNEFRALRGGEQYEPVEANPMIGYRGCFRYISEPDLFRAELDAIIDVRKTQANLHLMVPFVRTEWELRECLRLVRDSALADARDLELWVMAEVPSVIWRIADYAALGITGLSIGSNDLTQLILGVDRDNDRLATLFNERDSAVLAAIREIVARGHESGLTVSICGQAPSLYPEYVEFLVEAGIDSVSVVPDALELTRRNIARAEEGVLLRAARGH